MPRYTASLLWAAAAFLLLTACGRQDPPPAPTTSADPALVVITGASRAPAVKHFQSGAIRFETAPLSALVAFREDLIRRAEYDMSQHGGKTTPMTPFFDEWLDKVEDALIARGCRLEPDGTVRGPAE